MFSESQNNKFILRNPRKLILNSQKADYNKIFHDKLPEIE